MTGGDDKGLGKETQERSAGYEHQSDHPSPEKQNEGHGGSGDNKGGGDNKGDGGPQKDGP